MNPKSKAFKASLNIHFRARSINLKIEIDHSLIVAIGTLIVKAIIAHFL